MTESPMDSVESLLWQARGRLGRGPATSERGAFRQQLIAPKAHFVHQLRRERRRDQAALPAGQMRTSAGRMSAS